MEYELQLTPSRDAVWVHASDGVTVGRFGKLGIDIHNSMEVQLETFRMCHFNYPLVVLPTMGV